MNEFESTFLEARWLELAAGSSASSVPILNGRAALSVVRESSEWMLELHRVANEGCIKQAASFKFLKVKVGESEPHGSKSKPGIVIRFDALNGVGCLPLWLAMAETLLKAVVHEGSSQPISSGKKLRQTLKEWAMWWPTKKGLSDLKLKGLFAELTFLERLAETVPAEAAISSWNGPNSGDHDFGLAGLAFEVKSRRTGKVIISNLDQLDDGGLTALYLVGVGLRPDKDKQHSLAQLGERVIAKLSVTREEQTRMNHHLKLAGWFKATDDQKLETCFRVAQISMFHVKEGFPRFLRSDLERFPKGVGVKTYTLDLNYCGKFKLSESEASAVLSSLNVLKTQRF